MTDERFDQILKQALTPQNDSSELEIKKRVRSYNMKKLTKRVFALAACAAICLCGYKVTNLGDSSALTKVSDAFTVKVYAQELTSNGSIPINLKEDLINSQVICGGETEGSVNYCINLPLSCEGENIKHITYSINKGCFQIVEPVDSSYLVDYIEHEGDDINCGIIGGIDELREGDTVPINKVAYLDSFTLDYSNQTGENFWINIVNVLPNMEEVYDLLWNSDDSADNDAKALNLLLSDVEITLIVTFEDGTQSSKVLGLESGVVDVTTDKGTYKMADIFIKEL